MWKSRQRARSCLHPPSCTHSTDHLQMTKHNIPSGCHWGGAMPVSQPWGNPGDTDPVEPDIDPALCGAPSSRVSTKVRRPAPLLREAQHRGPAWPAAGTSAEGCSQPPGSPRLPFFLPFPGELWFLSGRLIACLSLCPAVSLSAPSA